MALKTLITRASASLEMPADRLYEILTDYDGYAAWMPGLTASTLLAREGELAVAEFELSRPRGVKQAVECIQDRNAQVLVRSIGGATPLAQLQWTLSRSTPGWTEVTLAVSFKLRPALLRAGGWTLVRAGRLLDGLKRQAGVLDGVPDRTSEAGETLIELVDTGEELVLWIGGKKYRVVEC
jgi:ribosome-associated toxin RatA of RatAB toxin-antitoxin module